MYGACGAYRPDPDCDWHLFVGDESALPAICSALEALAADPRGSKPGSATATSSSCRATWAAGRTEDVFPSEKRQPIGQI